MIKLYNTLTKQKEILKTIEENKSAEIGRASCRERV